MRISLISIVVAMGIASSWTLSGQVRAADYPVEFSDFFEMQQEDVMVRLAGDAAGLKVEAQASYDQFLLANSQVASLERYLVDKGLSDSAAETIAHALTQGVPANPGCKVSLVDCKPGVTGEEIQYVFDYDNNTLTIFVGSASLTHAANGEIAYHTAARASNAFVNQARLYSYADQHSNGGVTASNLTTIGLPYGHLLFNTQAQSASGDFDVFKGVYDLEVEGFRAVAGYSERDQVFFNSTDFLNDDAEYTSYSLQVGSSRNLVRGGKDNLQSIYLFAPQPGQLEIFQGERLLLTRVVSEGRQDIAYSDLPPGVYNVRVLLRAGGQVVLDEQRQIVNSQQFSLPVGDWDYALTAGRFEDIPDQEDLSWLRSPEHFSQHYVQSRLSWRMADNVLVAGGITSNQDDNYGQVGVNYAWSDWLQASYMIGLFSSEDSYQLATLWMGPVFLSMNRFETDQANRDYRLASQLYDEFSYRQLSATYSAALWGGSSYVTYSHYDSESPYTQDEVRTSDTDDISAGWMTSLFGGQWSFDATYSKNESYDDFRVGVMATYTLDDNTTSNVSITTNKSGRSRAEGSLTKNMTHGDWTTSATASLALQSEADEQMEATFSGTVNGRTPWFNAGAYGYVGNNDRHMASMTLTGSQFISAEGVGFTHQAGSSFIHVTPEVTAVNPKGEHDPTQVTDVSLDDVNYNVRQGGRTTYHGSLDGGDTVIPLMPYTETEFVIDADSRNLHIENNVRREFAYPGTVYTVDAKVTQVVSQLFVLSDIHGKPVRKIRCVGEACSGVEPLSEDGVFRVNYQAGGNYHLVSSSRLCITESGKMRAGAIETYCLPGLMSEEGRVAFASGETQSASDLLYIGMYESTQKANATIAKLEGVGLAAQTVEVGGKLYLYVKNNKVFSLAQRTTLEELEAYIVLNDASVDKPMTAR
ncbi:TcfC E-set like domain-containing protein [Aeromonas sanarellii]|uniref:TcfC E-set like domain-containing protein n=1 Tax=Aeromonas sanarellii TaxID=633415 RepID=UPI00398845AE